MTHDPERDATLFLAGELTAPAHEAFSRHLLSCVTCRQEVELARQGRALAESTRTVAPPALRDAVRALVEAQSWAQPAPSRPRRRILVAAASVTVLVAGLAVALPGSSGQEPAAVRMAIEDFAAQELPGRDLPFRSTPDLSKAQLQPAGAGAGSYAGLAVTAFAYQDPSGRRMMVYTSDQPFPEATGAHPLSSAADVWVAERDGVSLLCARRPYAMLLVGADRGLVLSAAAALGITSPST